MDIPVIKMKVVRKGAQVPTLANKDDAGLDLYTTESVVIPPGKRALLPTGLQMAIPGGMVGLIWPRSKLASKRGLDRLAGVIDAGYRGEVMVSVINHGEDEVELRKGDRVAQLIVQPTYSWLPIEVVDELDETERGASGIHDSEMRLN